MQTLPSCPLMTPVSETELDKTEAHLAFAIDAWHKGNTAKLSCSYGSTAFRGWTEAPGTLAESMACPFGCRPGHECLAGCRQIYVEHKLELSLIRQRDIRVLWHFTLLSALRSGCTEKIRCGKGLCVQSAYLFVWATSDKPHFNFCFGSGTSHKL